MRFTSATVRFARAGGIATALLLGNFAACAPTAGAQPAQPAQPTPPGGGGGYTNPEPCVPDFGPCPPDPCDDGTEPVDGECPPPPDPCDTDTPPDECLPPPDPCDDGTEPVGDECPPPPDPCDTDTPPEGCGDSTPDPGGHGTVDQPVPGTPTFTG